ncbi:hypothetical protein [Ekhidna sp.]|uniref:hypothetical protein n=1 Tax=Ekhidna sp. TaxID=2608089 RepID=UPI003CCC2337
MITTSYKCNTNLLLIGLLTAFTLGDPTITPSAFESEVEEKVEVITVESRQVKIVRKAEKHHPVSIHKVTEPLSSIYSFVHTIRIYVWVQAFLL